MKNSITYIVFFLLTSTNLIGQEYEVSGKVTKPDGTPLVSVRLELQNLSGNSQLTYTNGDGAYSFQMVQAGEHIVHLDRVEDITSRDNISIFDILLISRHVIGADPFDEIHQLLAADVNGSGSITTFDMVILKKFILDPRELLRRTAIYYRELEEGIVSSGTSFVIANNITDLDFIGIQIGDVGNL